MIHGVKLGAVDPPSLRRTDAGSRLASWLRSSDMISDASRLSASWLTHMRWHVVGAQVVVFAIASAMHVALPLPALLACVAAMALSNVLLVRGSKALAGAGAILVLDIALLTIELRVTGGASNPFAVCFLVQILLAGLLLRGPWVAAITSLAVGCFAWLSGAPDAHTFAFALIAMFTAMITSRTAKQLMQKQRIAAHASSLASLSTLAAGAAHELGSPLGTIAVASEELDALIVDSPEEAIHDARVIREEVARCRDIVHRMNARAGQLLGEVPEPTKVGVILEDLKALMPASEQRRLVFSGNPDDLLKCPTRSLVRILGNLVANALQASDAVVTVSVLGTRERVAFVVEDRGPGIPFDIQAKLGEPFVTTKPPGEGMGLGLFLSFSFAELCSGRLELAARDGGGTTATLELPRSAQS